MEQSKIVVCEYSKIIQNLIKSFFTKEKDSLVFFDNAYDALLFMQSNTTALLIASVNLQPFNGFHLTHLLKDNKNTQKINILLYYTEEKNLYHYYAEKSYANAFVYFNTSDINEFHKKIDSFLKETEFTEYTKKPHSEKELAISTLQTTENIAFNYMFLESLFEMNLYLDDTEALIKNLLYLITKILNVEICSFIIHAENGLQKYSLIAETITKKEVLDFAKICKYHFDSYLSNDLDTNSLNTLIEKTYTFRSELNATTISSYEHFVLYANTMVGTLHIASAEHNYFTENELKILNFFCEKISFMIEVSLNFTLVVQKEIKMKKMFSRFVPEEIIDNILRYDSDAKQLIGEKRMVSVIIVDIRDFTAISEINAPENVVSFLNLYFTHMVEIIKKNGGSVDKFMGDSILALFGATTSHEDNAKRAVQAALEMKEIVSQIDTSLLVFPENHSFQIGIGIHQGNVVVGNIGCQEKIDYTVIGDSVNLASRLEGLTKQYGTPIIVSDAINKELDENFFSRHLDNVRVKGKSIPVSIFAVMRKKDAYSKDFQEIINKAMELYVLGAWNLAYNYFTKALELMPNDRATQVLQKRCETFILDPPKNWDGSITLLYK